MRHRHKLQLFGGLLAVMMLIIFAADFASARPFGHTTTVNTGNHGSVHVRHGLLGRHHVRINNGSQQINVRHGLLGRHHVRINNGAAVHQNQSVVRHGFLGHRQTTINTGVSNFGPQVLLANQGYGVQQQFIYGQPQRLLLNQINTFTANPYVGTANLVVQPASGYSNYSYNQSYAYGQPAQIVSQSPVYSVASGAPPSVTTTTTQSVVRSDPEPTPAPEYVQQQPQPQPEQAPPAQAPSAQAPCPPCPPCPQQYAMPYQPPQYTLSQQQYVVTQPQYVVTQPQYGVTQPAFLVGQPATSYSCNYGMLGRRNLVVNAY